MARFAYILNPSGADRLVKRLPVLRVLPRAWLETAMGLLPPTCLARIHEAGQGAPAVSGWILECPLTNGRLAALPPPAVASRLIRAGHLAGRLGASVVGMAGHLARAAGGEAGLAGRLNLTVTTGRILGLSMALDAARREVGARGLSITNARVAILGATGPAGVACSHILAREARFITLVSGDRARAEVLAGRILRQQGVSCRWTADHREVLPRADLVVAADEAANGVEADLVKAGAVVCMISGMQGHLRPLLLRRDVGVVADVLIHVPGRPDLGPAAHLRRGVTRASMAEAMILALEGEGVSRAHRWQLAVDDVDRMAGLARRYGFRPAV